MITHDEGDDVTAAGWWHGRVEGVVGEGNRVWQPTVSQRTELGASADNRAMVCPVFSSAQSVNASARWSRVGFQR